MPRKTSIHRQDDILEAVSFNEAAARCRGKPSKGAGHDAANPVASMRPRPDAAENPRGAGPPPDRPRVASMRPRPDAAENPPTPLNPSVRFSALQ